MTDGPRSGPDAARSGPDADRRLLGEMLVEAGLTTRAGLTAGLEEQQLRGGRLGFNLMKVGSVVPAAFHLFLQDHLESLAPDLVEAMRVAPAVDLIPARLAHHYGMVPIRVGDGLLDLAVSNADSAGLMPAVEELTGLRVEPVICPPSLIAHALARFYPEEVEVGIVQRPQESLLLLADRRRNLRPMLPELMREDAPAGDWLRALLAEAIRRGARRMRIEPGDPFARVDYDGALVDWPPVDLPRGAAPGVLSLLAGLAGILSRGRVAPREGSLTVAVEGRRIRIAILMLPGLAGDTCRLDLRDERVLEAGAEDLAADLPGLPAALQDWASAGRGLMILAAPGRAERDAGLAVLLRALGDRLPVRLACAPEGEFVGIEALGGRGDEDPPLPAEAFAERIAERAPDLIVLPESSPARPLTLATRLAGEAAVLASVVAVDAFDAAEQVARREGRAALCAAQFAGILAARVMETLCAACARPFDLRELLAPWPGHRAPLPGEYFTSQGCDACRGSGQVRLEPAFEFLPGAWLRSAGAETARAVSLRRVWAREGRSTLFQAGLRRAAAGRVDVRDPLRLLLHELA